MTRLNQLLAVEASLASEAHSTITKAHQQLGKESLVNGIARTYQPVDEEGEVFPPEGTLVQVRAGEEIAAVQGSLGSLWDATARKDWTNLTATADVALEDGTVLVHDAPVTFLLWMEKRLEDLKTFVTKLPVLDPGVNWTWDETTATWRSDEEVTRKTKKVPKAFIKYAATKEHPAQVDVFTEDVKLGEWHSVKFSGALPRQLVRDYRRRVIEVQRAIKRAREQGNLEEVTADVEPGSALLAYVFGPNGQTH